MDKNISKTAIALAALAFTLASCEPNMEFSNPNAMTTGTYYKTADELEIGVNAAYSMLQSGGLYGRYGYYTFNSRGDDWDKTYKAAGAIEVALTSN